MGGASLQEVCLVKGRIALYAGYFVAMLLLAAYFTGVLQQGILSRFRHQATAAQHDEKSAISDQQPASQGSDQASATEHTPADPAPSVVPEEKPSKFQVPNPEPGTRNLKSGSGKPALSRVEGSAAADRQEKLLEEKRAELLRLEEQIRKRKEESEVEEKWVAELKASGAKFTKERDTRREAGIQKLAKLYEGMDPEAAASILSKLEKNMAAKVLASMKDRSASKVLAAMNGQKAKDLSERLQEVRSDQTAGQERKALRPGSGQAAEETP